MKITKSFRPADLLELRTLHGNYMFEETAESGYSPAAASHMRAFFMAKATEMGLDVLQAEDAVQFACVNYDALYAAWNKEFTDFRRGRGTKDAELFDVEVRAAA